MLKIKTIIEPVYSWEWWKSIVTIVVGCVIMAAGYNFFVSPYNIVPGGVYGLGIVLHNIFPTVQVGTFGYMMDIPLLTSAILIFGRQFGGRTLFAACLTPGVMTLVNKLSYPTQTALERLDPSQLLGGCVDLSNALILASIMGGVTI